MQAALEYFGDSVEYLARPTIAGELPVRQHVNLEKSQSSSDVQQTLSAAVPFGLIPQENSINGSVVETYNILRIPAVGQETFVRGVTVFGVKHSLVTRRGVKLENIEKVLSHEQVRSCDEIIGIRDSISRWFRHWDSAGNGYPNTCLGHL